MLLILTRGALGFNLLLSETNYLSPKISKTVWPRKIKAIYKITAIKENQTSHPVACHLICQKAMSSCMLGRIEGRLIHVKRSLVVSPDSQLRQIVYEIPPEKYMAQIKLRI